MKKKFVGPANPGPDGEDLGHDVVVAGHQLGVVKAGEVIEVPDGVEVAWPQEQWEDVKSSPKKQQEGAEG